MHDRVEGVALEGLNEHIGPAVAGDADEAHLARLTGLLSGLQGPPLAQDGLQLVELLHGVHEEQVHMVGPEVVQRSL